MKIRKRWLLVWLISGAQLALLLLGLFAFERWLERELHQAIRQQVLTSNEQAASQMALLIQRMDLDRPRPGTEAWRRLQNAIEQIELPNDGFLCVVDSGDGRLLCHPELRRRPKLKGMQVGRVALTTGAGSEPLIQATDRTEVARGSMDLPSGIHLVGARAIPELGIHVLAHQHMAGIQRTTGRIIGPLYKGGVIACFLLSGLTLLVTGGITRRYENRLARINGNLEQIAEQRSQSLLRTRDAVIFGLAKLAESRDDETGEHLERIQEYVGRLTRELARTRAHGDLDENFVRTISLASSLHDIGKVGIPDAVLLKPGRLTDEEFRQIQRHPVIGGDCLLAIKRRLGEDDFLTVACEVALAHHERWDGSGYPFGSSGTDIPLSARIVALADVYDVLTTPRVYKSAMPHEQACRIIYESSGTHFDPAVVEAFRRQEEAFAEMVARRTENDQAMREQVA